MASEQSATQSPTQSEQSPKDQEGFKLLTKVSSYETSQYLVSTAKSYYQSLKNTNPLLKKGCETVEAGLDRGMKTLNTTVIEPVVHTQAYKKYTEPILTTVDDFGCRQLEKMESMNESLQENVKASKEKINYWRDELKLKGVAETSWELVQEGTHVIGEKVAPVDNYLKDSVLGVPLNLALTVTEKVADPFLPKSEEGDRKEPVRVGPITRAGRLSKRVQTQLQHLTFRRPGQVSFYVDLINYAATQLDTSVKTTSDFFSEKGQQVTELGKAIVAEGQKRVSDELQQVREKVKHNTTNAVLALQKLVDHLADRLPKEKVKDFKAKVANMSEGWLKLETEEDANLFSKVAKRSMKKLEKIKERLAQYSTTDAIPSRIITSVGATIASIVDRFQNMASGSPETQKKAGEGEDEEEEEGEQAEEMKETSSTTTQTEATK